MPVDQVVDICPKTARRGEFVRLTRDANDDKPEKPRLGRTHGFGLYGSDFTDMLCIPASERKQLGIMELKEVLLLLRWVLFTFGIGRLCSLTQRLPVGSRQILHRFAWLLGHTVQQQRSPCCVESAAAPGICAKRGKANGCTKQVSSTPADTPQSQEA